MSDVKMVWTAKNIPYVEELLKGQKDRLKGLLEFSHGVIHSGVMDCKKEIKRYEGILKEINETPAVSPLWLVRCTSCGYETWNLHYSEVCSKCGFAAVSTPANQEQRSWDGTIKKSQSN